MTDWGDVPHYPEQSAPPLHPVYAEHAKFAPKKGELKKLFKDEPDLDTRTAKHVLEDIRRESRESPKPRLRWVPQEERHLLEIDVFDLHVGKLAWPEETGEDYNARIASERAIEAVEDLLAQAVPYPLERILLPWGNDFLHYDTLSGLTTAGTPQDRDSRYQLMFRRASALSRQIVRRCAEIAPVDVLVMPGNHDSVSSFTLGMVLEAAFEADPRVSVDVSPRPRKYREYGVNLLGFAHGHEEPHKRYPMLMPVEEPEAWSHTKFREFHVGHFHKSKVTDPVR